MDRRYNVHLHEKCSLVNVLRHVVITLLGFQFDSCFCLLIHFRVTIIGASHKFAFLFQLTNLKRLEYARVLVELFLFIPVNFFDLFFHLFSSICLIFSPTFSKRFLSVANSAGKLACKRLLSSVSIDCTTFFDSLLSNSIFTIMLLLILLVYITRLLDFKYFQNNKAQWKNLRAFLTLQDHLVLIFIYSFIYF